ncbi:unnamed protein product [Penicillium egyptiacum]|uniref:Polyketide synthase n=1 Tax=Penicillium egyptiacum TaxID=1303716 RepID=A0A9W4KCV2_9EURO|nr:unnamed protein product [Penicillium egyptiacum]
MTVTTNILPIPGMAASQRIVFFGGQGSRAIFSSKTSAELNQSIQQSSSVESLFKACHAAFLGEIEATKNYNTGPSWANLDDFQSPDLLISVPQEHWQNPIVQGVALCLQQLATYLQQSPSLDHVQSPPLGVIGFCSGVLPALVLASSRSISDYIEHSRQAIRLAYWIGYRAGELSRSISNTEGAWGLSGTTTPNNEIRLSNRFGRSAITVVGPWGILDRFRAQCLTGRAICDPVHVHALYHGGDLGCISRDKVLLDVERREISFPSVADLAFPIWSPQLAKFIDSETSLNTSLLQITLDSILVERDDLYMTWINLSQLMTDAGHDREIMTVGPGAHGIIHNLSKDLTLPRTTILNMTGAGSNRSRTEKQDGFAVVGMSVNFPLGATKEEFWNTLESGLNSVEEIPTTRFKVEQYSPSGSGNQAGNSRHMPTRHGNFLSDPHAFDHQFFNISPREAKSMDPQQKLLLQGALRALDDAGYVPNATPSFQTDTMGCYIGVATDDYVQNLMNDIDVYSSTGTLRAFLSGKISYAFGWSGPSLVTDTACSSSLVSIALACRALANGDCSAALVGGVNAITSPDMYMKLSRAHFLSPTGQCKPFDATADGYCRAEGCGLFVIKPLADAVHENDRIHGVIRGVELNQSGNAHSITHPHVDTQERLMQKLLRKTKLDARSVNVVEAHGTGTQAGDATEASSIQRVFGITTASRPVFLTSVKANIGHAEAASGAAGLAKLLLMLQKKRIPAQVGLKYLNPKLTALASNNIRITTVGQDWPTGQDGEVRRALLNNFGAAGSNAALILEEYSSALAVKLPSRTAYNLIVSAKTEGALQVILHALREMLLSGSNIPIRNLCYTLTARRQVYDYRVSLVCKSTSHLLEQLANPPGVTCCKSNLKPRVIFVFSGQGSFYVGMGKVLLSTSPVFQQTVQQCDLILQNLDYPEIMPIIRGTQVPRPGKEHLVLSQVACFVVEYALAYLWLSWDVQPELLIGHSLGDYVAMAISGVLSLKDALWLVSHRAQLMADNCQVDETTMLACQKSASDLTDVLKSQGPGLSHITLSCENTAHDSVVSGPRDEIRTLSDLLSAQGTRCTELNVSLGFHSPALDPIIEPLERFCRGLQFSEPKYPIGSSYNGRLLTSEDLTSEYIPKQTRHVVQFAALLSSLDLQDGKRHTAFIDIGAAPITLPMIRKGVTSDRSLFLPSLKKDQDPWETLCASLQTLSLQNEPVNWRQVFSGTNARIMDCPEYPLQNSTIHIPFREMTCNHEQQIPSATLEKPRSLLLLTDKVQEESADSPTVYMSKMEVLSSYLLGHAVAANFLCPASVYHEMALEAGVSDSLVGENEMLVVKDLSFERPLLYQTKNGGTAVYLSVKRVGTEWHFDVASGDTSLPEANVKHCSGLLLPVPLSETRRYLTRKAAYMKRQIHHLQGSHTVKNVFHTKAIYNVIFSRVVQYSPEYHSLERLTVAEDALEAFGAFKVPGESIKARGVLSPVFVDTLLHAAGFVANSHIPLSDVCICVRVENVRILYQDLDQSQRYSLYCSLLDGQDGTLVGEAFAMTEAGIVVACVEGMHFKQVKLKTLHNHLSRQSQRHPSASPSAAPSQMTNPVDDHHRRAEMSIATARQTVMDLVSATCGRPVHSITQDCKLSSLGVDSLMKIELCASLSSHFANGLSLSSAELDEDASVRELQDFVAARMLPPSDHGQIRDAVGVQSPDVQHKVFPSQESSGHASSNSELQLATEYLSDSSSQSAGLERLVKIFSDVCGIPESEINHDMTLANLGLDSMMAIEAREFLEHEFGKGISSEDLDAELRVSDLAVRLSSTPDGQLSPSTATSGSLFPPLEGVQENLPDPVLTMLQAGSPKLPTLVLFHDGSGTIESYRRLGKIGCNIMGVANPPLKGSSHWAADLKDMARRYASTIKASAISPIILGGIPILVSVLFPLKPLDIIIMLTCVWQLGWSFGGVVAHEVAQQLKSQDYDTLGIILIDSPCPLNHEPLPSAVVNLILHPVHATSPRITEQFAHHARFLADYRPSGSIPEDRLYGMLHSQDCLDTTRLCGVKYPWLEDANARIESLSNWQSVIGQELLVFDIPGNHFEPFKPANVSHRARRKETDFYRL